MKKIFLMPLACLVMSVVCAQVIIPSTQKLSVKSSIIDQEYDLLVHLPGDYGQQKDKRYPVMYLLDAQWDFPLVTGLYGSQYYDGFIPGGMIIVGITWGGKDPNPEALRFRDFTPAYANQTPGTGGADKFLSVIKNEFIPYIDSAFRTKKNDRILTGSSLGGLLTLYTLFTQTSLFNRYILTSPALQYGNGILNELEKKLFEKKTPLNVKLYMAHGELENPGPFEKFAALLKSRNHEGLQLQTRVLDHIGHSGTKAEGYARGMQWVFSGPSLKLPNNILNNYAGKYQIGNETLTFTNESGRLVATAPGNDKIVLEAETETDFYLSGSFLRLHFKKDASGKVSGFDLEQFRGTEFVKKVSN